MQRQTRTVKLSYRENGNVATAAEPFWSPFGNLAITYNGTKASTPVVIWDRKNSTVSNLFDDRAYRFLLLQSALRKMREIPTSEVMHVSEGVAIRAADLLASMSHNFEIDPPRILPEEDGAVVLTWDEGNLKTYLTVDEDDWDIMSLHKAHRIKCVHDVSEDEPLETIIELLGARSLSSSVTGENV